MGLLSKASTITLDKKLAFSDFVISHNIKTFAIYRFDGKYFSIINSIGFDGSSILSSLSTLDFWNGICPDEDKVVSFSFDNKTLNPMLQFFSFDLIDQIKEISLFKKKDSIYMLCDKKFTTDIINDLSKIDLTYFNLNLNQINKRVTKNTKFIKYKIDFNEAVLNFINKKNVEKTQVNYFVNSLCNELINQFSCKINKYLSIKNSSSSIKIIIDIDKSIHEEHLICHLIYMLRDIIGNSSEYIEFTNLGTANSINEITDFFKVD